MSENLIKGIHHICVKVTDIPKSVDFYTQKMDYKVRFRWDGGAMLDGPDGTRLEFFPAEDEKGYVHIAYVCDEVDKAYQLAVDSGCESVLTPRDIALPSTPPLNVRIAFFKDPLGNTIELFHEYND